MLTSRERKNRVYEANNLKEERYHQLVDEGVAKEISPSEENAILRKAVAYLFDLIATLHPDEIQNEEFKRYHERVEEIKRLAKEEIKIT